MGVRSTNPLQSFIDDFYRSGTDAAGVAPLGAIDASGGTTATYTGYKSHTFTASGSFVVNLGSGNVDVLIVGAGGGGGFDRGGGGGAGNLLN